MKKLRLTVIWNIVLILLVGCGASPSSSNLVGQPGWMESPRPRDQEPFDEIGLALVGLAAQKKLDVDTACNAYRTLLNGELRILRFRDVLKNATISLVSCGDFSGMIQALDKIDDPSTIPPLAPLIRMSDALAKNQPLIHKESLRATYPLLLSNRIALYWSYQSLEQRTNEEQKLMQELEINQFQIDDIKLYRELVMLYTEILANGFAAAFQGNYLQAVENWSPLYEQIDDPLISAQIARFIVYALALSGQQEEALRFLETQSYDDPLLQELALGITQQHPIDNIFVSPRDNLAEIFLFIATVYRQDLPEEAFFYTALAQHIHEKPEISRYALLRGYIFSFVDNRHSVEQVREEASVVHAGMPYYLELHRLKARLLFRQGLQDDAIKLLDELSQLYPERRDILMNKADFLRFDEQLSAAIETYNILIEEIKSDPKPEHWKYYFNRGVTLEQNKSWSAAERDMVQALDLQPNEPRVLNYLGYSWVDRKIHLERGMDMLEKALKLAPNDAHIIDSVGWANYHLGNYEQALIHLERAVQMLSTDPIVNDHLGDVYWQIGREREAYFQWQRALQMSPDEQHTTELLRKITQGL